MSPQVVDFNADGHLDILVGTFDGSVHVAYGTENGFKRPVHVLDKNGDRIMLGRFWDYVARKWESTTRYDPPGSALPSGHSTSAVAFDWNGNGVFDLLLGDYRNGLIYRRMNEGSNTEPRFATVNLPLMCAGKPLEVKGKITTMRLVDWDGNGLMDLLCGSFGATFGDGTGGAVYLFRNIGKIGAPEFAKPVTLIPPSPKGQGEPTRPDAGLYPDAVDLDGDGRLDLVVGGFSIWTPPARKLSEEEQDLAARLREEIAGLGRKQSELHRKVLDSAADIEDEAERRARVTELLNKDYRDQFAKLRKSQEELRKQLAALVPASQRVGFVWSYRNITGEQP